MRLRVSLLFWEQSQLLVYYTVWNRSLALWQLITLTITLLITEKSRPIPKLPIRYREMRARLPEFCWHTTAVEQFGRLR